MEHQLISLMDTPSLPVAFTSKLRNRDILKLVGLPTQYKHKNFKKLIEIMALDKKSRGATLRFVILEDVAKPARFENPSFKVLNTAWEKVSK